MDISTVQLEELLRHLLSEGAELGGHGGGHAVVPEAWGGREFVRPVRGDHLLWEVEEGGIVYHRPDGARELIGPGHGMVLPGVLGGRFTVADDCDECRVHHLRFQLTHGRALMLDGPVRIGVCQGVNLADAVELYRSCEALGTTLGWLRLRAALASWIGSVCTNAAQPRSQQGLSPAVRRRCIGFIHEHLSEGFRLAELADAVGLNPVYLSARFRQTFGQSIRSYTTAARLSAARDLLTETDLPVGRVAEMAGFCDIYQFCRTFGRQMGTPPGRWRRMQGRV
jgi:AraC-like DNA-binding protein